MKVLSFGSCLSHLTARQLEAQFGYTLVGNAAHNRSDQFVKYWVEQTEAPPPMEEFERLVRYKPEHEEGAREILQNQYPERMGRHAILSAPPLFENLENNDIDLILLDNFMDLAAVLFTFRDGLSGQLFANAHMFENLTDFGQLGAYLTPEESAANWSKIVDWFRSKTKAKIVFLCFQYVQSINNELRYNNGREFYGHLKAVTTGLPIMPPIHPPMSHTKGTEDWAHFTDDVYHALAGYLHLHMIAGIPLPEDRYHMPPSYFDQLEAAQ